MDRFLAFLLVCVYVVTQYMTDVESCTCPPPEPYGEVCYSSFAINATVVSKNITYPEEFEEQPWTRYNLRYELNVHKVFTPRFADPRIVPSVLRSFGPGSLCGLELWVGDTYILTGSIYEDSDTGEPTLGADLCNFHLYVSGPQFSESIEYANTVMERINCMEPPPSDDYYWYIRSARGQLRQIQSVGHADRKLSASALKTPRKTRDNDKLKSFLYGKGQRVLAKGLNSFI